MDLQLTGKKALISAGHKGLGYFIAKRLLEEGAMVAICCRSEEDLAAARIKFTEKSKRIKSINASIEKLKPILFDAQIKSIDTAIKLNSRVNSSQSLSL